MDDLDDDETELILNWRKLTDGQRAALRQQMEERLHDAGGIARACACEGAALNAFSPGEKTTMPVARMLG